MTLVTLPYRTQLAAGQPEDIGMVLSDLDAILAVLNGDIRNDNINAAAAIAISKLAGYPTDASKFLRGDATWAAAGAAADGWLAAGETWTYASWDATVATGTMTIPGDVTTKYQAGHRIKFTQTTVKYAIITKVAFSAGTTTVTFYTGTDYTFANAAITLPYYSTAKAPFGFPTDPIKWSQTLTSTTDATQNTPTAATWYNTGTSSLVIPIGVWDLEWQANLRGNKNAAAADVSGTLSTGNSTESDTELTARIVGYDGGNGLECLQLRRKRLALTASATYYLNIKTGVASMTSIIIKSTDGSTVIRAVCALL